jgi:6-carboxyhexanoate--CoA ligase
MEKLWSIRMRASRTAGFRRRDGDSRKEIHISGAEGLYEPANIREVVSKYVERALSHPKGRVDRIVLTIEDIRQKPREISSPPLATVKCQSPAEGEKIVRRLLQSSGISERATQKAFALIRRGGMTGAAVITGVGGIRLDHDSRKGVRVSRLGLSRPASASLSQRLSRLGINTDTVREALTLASKVLSSRQIMAELCISDDPDYTTGYIASKKFGYVRIPNIKSGGSKKGGRAFFATEGAAIEEINNYLQRTPVMITDISPCRGLTTIDEILGSSHR